MSDTYRRTSKKTLYAGIGVAILLIVLITWAFVASIGQTTRQNAAAVAARSDTEKAYENIIKDSLTVYHSRYAKYPTDYNGLLSDIEKTPDIYGVNDQGMSELKSINNYLAGFSYGKRTNNSYTFTYQEVNSGETVTVTNK